jgi:hypothetical protein
MISRIPYDSGKSLNLIIASDVPDYLSNELTHQCSFSVHIAGV